MAKKNSTFGKFLAFTTTVAAIGGVCYVFRDQIKDSSIYKKATDKLSDLRNKMSDKFASEDDDFFFDDEFEDEFVDDIFSNDEKKNREYTSITINSKETIDESAEDDTQDTNQSVSDETTSVQEDTEDVKEIFANDSIPTITFDSSDSSKDETSATEEVLGYENENLSDVYEDPDVLEDMDKLDF